MKMSTFTRRFTKFVLFMGYLCRPYVAWSFFGMVVGILLGLVILWSIYGILYLYGFGSNGMMEGTAAYSFWTLNKVYDDSYFACK